MLDFISRLNAAINIESIFWFCALSGTGMLVIQLLMGLAGADHHLDSHELDDSGGSMDDGKFKRMTKQFLLFH